MIAVTGIMAVMIGLAVPAFIGIAGGGDVTRAAYDVAGVFEEARAHAMANNTYVLVGLQEVDSSVSSSSQRQVEASGSAGGRIALSVVASRSGVSDYSAGAGALAQVSKLVRVENMRLEPSAFGGFDLAEEEGWEGFGYPLGGSQYRFTKVVEFTPQGVARLPAEGFSMARGGIGVRILPARGPSSAGASQANYADVRIDSPTGAVRVLRP